MAAGNLKVFCEDFSSSVHCRTVLNNFFFFFKEYLYLKAAFLLKDVRKTNERQMYLGSVDTVVPVWMKCSDILLSWLVGSCR